MRVRAFGLHNYRSRQVELCHDNQARYVAKCKVTFTFYCTDGSLSTDGRNRRRTFPCRCVTSEHAGSSPYLQEPATGPYPEPTGSTSPPPPPGCLRSVMISSSHLRLGLPSGLCPSRFPTKRNRIHLSVLSTGPTHLIILELICLMIFEDGYKL
jgi:hypothetical protein